MNSKIATILNKLKSTRRQETVLLLNSGLLNTLSASLLVLLMISVVELLAHGDVSFRSILFGILILGFGVAFYYFLMPNFLRALGFKYNPDLNSLAIRVGKVYPDIEDKLANSLQLVSDLNLLKGTSGNLAEASFDNIYDKSINKDFNKIIEKDRIKKSLLFFLAIVPLTAILFIVFSSSLGASLYRIVQFNKSFIPPAPFTLSINKIDNQVLRGSNIKIIIKASGKIPDLVQICVRELQQKEFDVLNLKGDSLGNFEYNITSIKKSVVFFAKSPWMNTEVKTEMVTITVADLPLVRNFAGRVNYPTYTNLSGKDFNEQSGDITALKGSNVNFSIVANKDLKSAQIYYVKSKFSSDSIQTAQSDTTLVNLSLQGRKAFGGFNISNSGYYFFKLTDNDNLISTNPVVYSIVAQNDEWPTINLEEPRTDVQLSDDAILPIKAGISDDYGFSNLTLNYRLIESRYADPDTKFATVQIPFPKGQTSLSVPYIWDLNKVNISPEDKYEFYLEVFDNDRVSGPKSAKTKIYTLRLPSLDEVLKSTDNIQEQVSKDVQKLVKQAEEVKKDMEQMNRELLQKPKGAQLDWKEKKKTEDLLKKQDDIKKKIEDVQKNLDEMTKKLEENKAISPETLAKYMELQKLLKEVSAPELKKLQDQIQEAMQKMSPEELQKALKNNKFDEEQFRKSIERTMKLLKRLQAEQKTDAIQKRTEDLIKKQEELNKKMNNSNPQDKKQRDELAKEQKELGKDLEKLNEDIKDLDKLMKDLAKDMPMSEMEKAKEDLNMPETAQEMDNAEQEMEKSDLNKADKSQKKATSNLKKFAESMKQVKKKMQDKVAKEAMKKMQKSMEDLLELSKQQEKLKQQSQNTDYNSTKIPEMSENQSDIEEGLENVANSMMELSQKSMAVTPEMGSQIGKALQQMQKSMQEMANRNMPSAAQAQQQSMAAMNNAAAQMQAMISAMQNQGGSCDNPGGSGSGKKGTGMSFGQKLQQLAQQQQGINSGMQSMGSQASNNGQLSPEQQAELGRIANEQGRAQKALQDLANEQKQFGGEKKALGSLDKIVQEMQEVLTDLQSGNVNPETMKKQDRILSRLLDASVSMNERDFEKKRESTTGKEMNRQGPSDAELEKINKAKSIQDMMRTIQQGYTKDYEMIIRKYFEALQNQGNSPK